MFEETDRVPQFSWFLGTKNQNVVLPLFMFSKKINQLVDGFAEVGTNDEEEITSNIKSKRNF